MAGLRTRTNKAKIARRVIEVLEYFDEEHPEATVMDIVRRYDRPQSSTSELLSSLVELGLLHKDPYARSYRPTTRAALLGATSQHGPARDGRLVQFMDRLAALTGLPVLLVTKVGLEAQIVNTRQGGNPRLRRARTFRGGMREPLSQSAAGWLLLSTLEEGKRDAALRRLNAEASDGDKFHPAEMAGRIVDCRENGFACGPAGFGSPEKMVAMLLPCGSKDETLAASIIMETLGQQDSLIQCLRDSVQKWLVEPEAPALGAIATAA